MSGPQWTVGASDAGLRLDKFLAAAPRMGSRARASAALERGKVFVNGEEAGLRAAAKRLASGDIVRLWLDRPGSARPRADRWRFADRGDARDLHIVFEDDALIVLDKPAGLLAVPLERRGDAGSAYEELARYLRIRRQRRPLVVHRIDRDTSGLVVFAKRADAQRMLKEQFKRRKAERVYRAIVYGHPTPSAGTWRDHLVWDDTALVQKEAHPRDPRAREAVSEYRVIETFDAASLIEVRLVTGKRNQIRLQARLRGHTLVGERRYVETVVGSHFRPTAVENDSRPLRPTAVENDSRPLRPIAFPRQALHAYRLAFTHPLTGTPLEFEAPLPDDLTALVARLRGSRPR